MKPETLRKVRLGGAAVGFTAAGALGTLAVTGERPTTPITMIDGAGGLPTPTPDGVLPMPTPVPSERPGIPALEPRGNGLFSVAGIPTSVDISVVDVADNGFGNTLGHGTEGFFAEPGKLLVGPEFPQNLIDSSGGAIDRINPINQEVFTSGEPERWNLPEGGFTVISAATVTVQIGDQAIHLEGQEGRNWLLVLRGPNADGQQDSDLNSTITISDYVAGHAIAMNYDGDPAGGFISEGQLKQLMETSHTGGTNCGAEGCSKVGVAMLDVNTGAMAVVENTMYQGQPFNPAVTPVYSNFPTKS